MTGLAAFLALPTVPAASDRFRRRLALGFAVGGALAVAVLALRDPARGGYPSCPFLDLTGWQCAGCGTLRAVHQLAHGHPEAAFRLNPLSTLFSPVIGLLWVNEVRILAGRRSWRLDPRLGRSAWLLPAVIVIFILWRNLA